MLRSLASAFLMYSRIPMPKVEWKEENRRYVLCFFPLVGIVTGALFVLWYHICGVLELNDLMKGAVAVFIPAAVTGGIHLDGFCDVSDARAFWGDKEQKLSIMKDHHIGAFAAIKLALYLIMQTAVFSQISSTRSSLVCGLCFVLSRALSGIAAVTFRSANKEGTLESFVAPCHKRITLVVLSITAISAFAAMIVTETLCGAISLFAAAAVFIHYRHMAYKEFGGITGDLAGWFLQLVELILPMTIVIAAKAEEVLL